MTGHGGSAVAVGDSLVGSGGAIVSPDLERMSWCERVARVAGWELETFAHAGYLTAQIAELVPATGSYDVAMTCAGTNDVLRPHGWSPTQFRAEYADLLTRVDKIADRLIVMGLVPNVGKLPVPFGFGWGRAARVADANRIIAEVAADFDATVVLPPALSWPVDMYGDHVHQTSAGNLRLANIVLAELGLDPETADFELADWFIRETRRRRIVDSVKRPPRGLALGVKGALARH